MIIKDVLEQLNTSEHPVAKALHTGEHFRVLVMGFKSRMKLKEHKAHLPSKLTVLSGEVKYLQDGNETILKQFDEVDIPIEITHSVEALEDSLCLLTQG